MPMLLLTSTPAAPAASWLFVASALGTALLLSCKHPGSSVAAANAAPLVDAATHKPIDFSKEMFVFWMPYNRSLPADEVGVAGVQQVDGEFWATYGDESFLRYLCQVVDEGLDYSLLPQDHLFSEGTRLMVTKQSTDEHLVLTWNSAKQRFDSRKAQKQQTLRGFVESFGTLAPHAADPPLFVVEAAFGRDGPNVGPHAYAGEISANGWRQGLGVLVTHQGKVAVGGFDHGAFAGRGRLTTVDGVTYEGSFVAGQLDGDVTVTFPSGNVYQETYDHGRFVHALIDHISDESKAVTEEHYQFGDRLNYEAQTTSPHATDDHELQDAEDPRAGSTEAASGAAQAGAGDSPDASSAASSGTGRDGGGDPSARGEAAKR